jgi:hypothetical protein
MLAQIHVPVYFVVLGFALVRQALNHLGHSPSSSNLFFMLFIFFIAGDFPTQGLMHARQAFYHLASNLLIVYSPALQSHPNESNKKKEVKIR